ncbi:hypothetical protein [Streptomyces scabiei]|uniref:hypothetical protein n=1 Tax=Streptomyces scabiei TaxID=1930 RepID=UPI001FF36CE7|nr:hypothetical protein [Streptomyces sp. LBUM 1487]
MGPAGQSAAVRPRAGLPRPDGQSFTEYDEPAVAGEGDSSRLQPAPVPGTGTVWSVGRADGPEGTFAPRILRFG